MDLQKILNEWKSDSQIEFNKLDVSSQETPKLHAKYLELYTTAKLKLKDAEFKQKFLLKEKWLYYNGKIPVETVIERGWNPDPFDGLKILKGEMDHYYNTDPEIVASEQQIAYLKEVVDTLKEIMDHVKWRHSTIKNMIDWKKFEAGF